MNVSKSSGPYSVPVTVLKIMKDRISDPLALLVNNSLASGNFPDELTLARILSIFKKSSRFDNCRSIFVFFNFSKMIKKRYVSSPP